MNNQKIIKQILREKSKGLKKFLKSQEKLLKQAKLQPDEEWSAKRDPQEGRRQKELMVEASHFTIGYITALRDFIPEVTELLDKSEKQIKKIRKAEKQAEKKQKKKDKKAEKPLATPRMVPMKDPHIEWCPAFGTGKEWAVDPDCNCPGASVVRKRMKKGATLEEAKEYIVRKGLDVMF